MDSRIALRVELENAISEAGCTLSKLQQIGGSHIGNLSDILRREGRLRPITKEQLDTLTEASIYQEGHYYDLYLAECFFNNRLAVPRMNFNLPFRAGKNRLDHEGHTYLSGASQVHRTSFL
ncbi:hypothetical protein P7H20_10695 [Paenibacillus larvae]|nr:hypothetical protein [Paenibacillus larvae]MDT2275216.1 hypothetical protein [Paenibacillus larvae]